MLYKKAEQLAVKIKEFQWKQNQKAKTYFEICTDPHGENVFLVSSTIPGNLRHLKQGHLKRFLHNSLHIFSAYLSKTFATNKTNVLCN